MTQHEQGLDAGAMLLLVVDCMGWWEVGIEPAVPRRFPPTQDVVDKLRFPAGRCSMPSPNVLDRSYPTVE
jgi:hypothetical protein